MVPTGSLPESHQEAGAGQGHRPESHASGQLVQEPPPAGSGCCGQESVSYRPWTASISHWSWELDGSGVWALDGLVTRSGPGKRISSSGEWVQWVRWTSWMPWGGRTGAFPFHWSVPICGSGGGTQWSVLDFCCLLRSSLFGHIKLTADDDDGFGLGYGYEYWYGYGSWPGRNGEGDNEQRWRSW